MSNLKKKFMFSFPDTVNIPSGQILLYLYIHHVRKGSNSKMFLYKT